MEEWRVATAAWETFKHKLFMEKIALELGTYNFCYATMKKKITHYIQFLLWYLQYFCSLLDYIVSIEKNS